MDFNIELLLLALAPVFLGCVAWEAWYWARRGRADVYSWRDTLCNAALALLHQGADKLAWLAVIPLYQYVYQQHRLFDLGHSWGHFVLLNLAFQFFVHTQAVPKLGWLEYVFNTPSIHRSHHARNPCYIDRNYAGVLVIWDRLFGSYVAERDDTPCDYGTLKPVNSYNPLWVSVVEWHDMLRETLAARSWRQRLTLLFGSPEAAERIAAQLAQNSQRHTP